MAVEATVDSPEEFVRALVEGADSPLLVAELAEALRYHLAPAAPAARDRRKSDLGLLAELVRAAAGRHPTRAAYSDARQGTDATTSHTLVKRYGSWWEACAIAARMEEDGKLPPGPTFSGGRTRGRFASKRYSTEETIAAFRLCAFSLGRHPSSTDYDVWAPRQRRRCRERRIECRIPSRWPMRRLFPGRQPWQRLLAAAAITDADLRKARAALLHQGDVETDSFLDLPLGTAAGLASELAGSLDWLAGRASHPGAVANPLLRFSPERYRTIRDSSYVAPERLARAAGLRIGPSRRLLSGTFEPTLGTVVTLASLLGVAAHDLCE